MAQINTTVGDLRGNAQNIPGATTQEKSLGVDLLTFPELAQIPKLAKRASNTLLNNREATLI